jgi:hypothetical protein
MSNKPTANQYALSSPTLANMWGRRSAVVAHVISSSDDVPAYSQIVNLTNGERFSLTGERLHLLDDTQWTRLLNLLVLTSLLVKRPAQEQEVLKLMLEQQYNEFMSTMPQSHQDEVVKHAIQLLSSKAEPNLEGDD